MTRTMPPLLAPSVLGTGRAPTGSALALAFGLLLAGCYGPPVPSGGANPPLVAVDVVADIPLDSLLPSDLLWRPDGDLLVLDGYGSQVLRFGPDGAARGPWGSPGTLGGPVRLSPARDGGVWAVVPGDSIEPGVLLHLDTNGAVDDTRAPQNADGTPIHPVDVVDLGDSLLIADREGAIRWLDPVTGRVTRSVTQDSEHVDLRRIVDLVAASDGTILAVDTLMPRIFRLGKDGTADSSFGRIGLSAGRLSRPTAAAQLEDGPVLVADAVLGVVQAFAPDGAVIGLLAQKGEALRFGHPVAVRVNAEARPLVAVLDARPAVLHLVRLQGPLPAAPVPSLIRTTLVAPNASPAGTDEGDSCLQCHDGLVRDGREVWDTSLGHHPRNVVPVDELPAFLPLDSQGRLVCTTCHSPHGVVSAAEAEAATSSSPPLVRHSSSGTPFLRLDSEADALCLACHTTNAHAELGSGTLARTSSGHPTGLDLVAALKRRAQPGAGASDPTTASCLSCHAMHGAKGKHITRDPGDGRTCLGCHPAMASTSTNHPLGRVPGRDLVAERRGQHVLLSGDGGIGCLSCHDMSADMKTGMLRSLPGKSVCLDCHSERTDLAGGAHAHLETGAKPTCIACHDVHGGERDERFLRAAPGTVGDPRGCLSCHGPGGRAAPRQAKPGVAGHPTDGRSLPDDKNLTCLSCHDPHAADRPNAGACATCHTEQGAAASRGGHGDADCLDCHPAHARAPLSSTDANPASARCLVCHGEGTAGADTPKIAHWDHPVPAFLPDGTRWTPLAGLILYAADGTPAAPGANGDLTCQTCHVFHGPEPSGEDHLRRASGWKAACAACHGDNALVLYRYFHSPERRADLNGATP